MMDSRSACIQNVLKVKVKVKGHVIRALYWILGMSYSVIDGLVTVPHKKSTWTDSFWGEVYIPIYPPSLRPCSKQRIIHSSSSSLWVGTISGDGSGRLIGTDVWPLTPDGAALFTDMLLSALRTSPLQESCAIAKMAARCALHMGALKISIFTRFRDIAAFVLQHATFHIPPPVSPKFSHVPLGIGRWPLAFGLPIAKVLG